MSNSQAIEVTAPALWAPYLLNGDDSVFQGMPGGLAERKAADAWLEHIKPSRPVVASADEQFALLHSATAFAPDAVNVRRYTLSRKAH